MDAQALIDWARGQNSAVALTAFAFANTLLCSVLPLPLGVVMMVVGGVLWGQVIGLLVYLLTSALGAWFTFIIVRRLKDRVIRMLGKHQATWERLDEAITREGLWICFLWRVAPIAPYVISSAMISMTNISQWDYIWTTSLGIIPSSFPIVSGAAMAGTYLIEKKSMDPVTLVINVTSIGAGIYVMVRLGAIAIEVMAKSGAQDSDVPIDAELVKPTVQQHNQMGQDSRKTCRTCDATFALPLHPCLGGRPAASNPRTVELV